MTKIEHRPDSRLKSFQHKLEYGLVMFVTLFIRLLPLRVMSTIAGWLGRHLGPRLSRYMYISKINIHQAFPHLTADEVRQIQIGMFDNFARTFTEYFYLDKLDNNSSFTFEIKNGHYFEEIKNNGGPAILFSGHYGNWEIGAWYVSRQGYTLTPIYRRANNPYVDQMVKDRRSAISDGLIVKGPRAGRECLQALKNGKRLVLLIDQKMDEGIDVPFFGKPAPTAVGVARLARAVKCPIVPTRVVRKDGLHFVIEFFKPFNFQDYEHQSDEALLLSINQLLEGWISEYPEQWLWAHRRWSKDFYQ